MRSKDPEVMKQILDYTNDYTFENHHSPTLTEISKKLGMGVSTIYRYVTEMKDKAMLTYDGKHITTKQTEYAYEFNPVAVYQGSIPCGSPDKIESSVERIVGLPEYIFGTGEKFIIRATGESMINAGIEQGDFIVAEKAHSAIDGDIVVVLNNNANTLKRLQHDSDGKPYLHPENDNMEDIMLKDGEELAIQGVARFVIKSL